VTSGGALFTFHERYSKAIKYKETPGHSGSWGGSHLVASDKTA